MGCRARERVRIVVCGDAVLWVGVRQVFRDGAEGFRDLRGVGTSSLASFDSIESTILISS
jgi:hypothetical protein